MRTPRLVPVLDWAADLIPRVLPPGWLQHDHPQVGLWFSSGDGLRVIFSGRVEQDGKRWVHVSCSRPNRLPGWQDVRNMKDIFLGPDRLAVQVFPRKRDYVNHHPFTLHLWSCLDGDPTPDFRLEDGVI